MTAGDYIAIIGSVGAIIITVVTLIVKRDVQKVHELVNSRSKQQDRRIAQLIRAMKKAGMGCSEG